ncbi:hypothetical protein [Pectinatus frisingensis]|uniref:hypothetical protein n=1 Tax=Pectinatus frisingensis TaxID=865 RepID=UPI003D804A32
MNTDEYLIICNGKNKTAEIESCMYNLETNKYDVIFTNNKNQKIYSYDPKSIEITHSCLKDNDIKDCMDYLKELAAINELKNDDGKILLQQQYEKLNFVSDDTVMHVRFINRKININKKRK